MAAETSNEKKLKSPAEEQPPPPPDRLSALPDDVLRRILKAADLDLGSAAQTATLSRRWRDLWKSTIRHLLFETPRRRYNTVKARRLFIESADALLTNREFASQLDFVSLTTNGAKVDRKYADVFGRILAYGAAHRVPAFQLVIRSRSRDVVQSYPSDFVALCESVRDLDLSLMSFDLDKLRRQAANFQFLNVLRLFRCELIVPPALAGTAGGYCGAEFEPLVGLPNLKKVHLIDCVFETKYTIKLSGEKLEEIEIVFSYEPHLYEMKISAPKATKLKLAGVILTRFTSVVMPSLESLDLDVFVSGGMPKGLIRHALNPALLVAWDDERTAGLNFLRTFEKFRRAAYVKLNPSAIEGLTMIPGVLEGRAPAFNRLEKLEVGGPLPCSRRDFIALLTYFFNDNIVANLPNHIHHSAENRLIVGREAIN